jgi:hypothetical protein
MSLHNKIAGAGAGVRVGFMESLRPGLTHSNVRLQVEFLSQSIL